MRVPCFAACAALASQALAQPLAAEPLPVPGSAAMLLQGTLGLAVVLALVWGTAWLVRRIAPARGSGSSIIRVIAAQSVGARERVVLLEIGDNWLVLGVAPGRVSALHTMQKGSLPAAVPLASPFARLLSRARGDA